MKLTFLGKGSCFNTDEINNSAYIKLDDENLMLIDCGEDVAKEIVRQTEAIFVGIKYLHIFITHTHSDHIGSLPSLLFLLDNLEITPIIYVGEKNRRRIESWLNISGVYPILKRIKIMAFPENAIKFFNMREPYLQIGDYGFNMIKTQHMNGVYNYMIVIYHKDEMVIYTGDCSYSSILGDKLFEKNPSKKITIYTDCSYIGYEHKPHYTLDDLCKLYSKKYRKNIYIMHVDMVVEDIAIKEGFRIVK